MIYLLWDDVHCGINVMPKIQLQMIKYQLNI